MVEFYFAFKEDDDTGLKMIFYVQIFASVEIHNLNQICICKNWRLIESYFRSNFYSAHQAPANTI